MTTVADGTLRVDTIACVLLVPRVEHVAVDGVVMDHGPLRSRSCHRVCRAHLCARAWKARIYGFYELRDFYHTESSRSIESYNYTYTIKLLL